MRALVTSLWSTGVLVGALLGSGPAQAGKVQGVDGQTVEVKAPRRVVAVNSSLVEIFFALGLGERVVGTDIGGNYPAQQARIPKVGHPYHPSVEGIISLAPDVVVASQENLDATTAKQLRGARLPVLVLESSSQEGLAGLGRRIDAVARLMEVPEAGQKLTRELEQQTAALKQRVAAVKTKPRLLFIYAHGPGEAFVYGRDTGVHALIELVGGQNAADFTTGTKVLTAEGLVQAAPDALLMLERGLTAVGGVEGALKLPGVALTPAGKNKKVIAVDDTVRWVGPRFPQFADTLFTAIHANARP